MVEHKIDYKKRKKVCMISKCNNCGNTSEYYEEDIKDGVISKNEHGEVLCIVCDSVTSEISNSSSYKSSIKEQNINIINFIKKKSLETIDGIPNDLVPIQGFDGYSISRSTKEVFKDGIKKVNKQKQYRNGKHYYSFKMFDGKKVRGVSYRQTIKLSLELPVLKHGTGSINKRVNGMISKKCVKCGKNKRLSKYGTNTENKTGLLDKCLICSKVDENKSKNEKIKSVRKNNEVKE